MSRSKWKGPFSDKIFFKSLVLKTSRLQVWSRRSVLTGNLNSKKLFIYNGRNFKPVNITREKFGFKLGEFALSHEPYGRKTKLKKK